VPKPATGSVRWFNGVASARVRATSDKRVSFVMPACTTEGEADERAQLLAIVAKRLRATTVPEEQVLEALKLVAEAAPRSLRNALTMVDEIAAGKLAPMTMPGVQTFQQLGTDWTEGKLAQRYPDQIRVKRSAHSDASRLTTYVYPVIGSLPIDRVSLDHCEEVMRRLPTSLAVASRRQVGQVLMRVFSMAVYPLRLIATSPIPSKGFLPALSKAKALAHLYPNEDLRLMQCTAVPLAYRLLWGFIAREGMRAGEVIALKRGDIDLERGGVRLDQNKTDDPRAWALNIGVLRALRVYFEHYRPHAGPDDHVFTDAAGEALDGPSLAPMLRDHLRAIKLDAERPELFATTAHRRQIRAHDLRGTFVTVSLANGKSEAWVMARTGHKSSAMIARYRRTAKTFEEIDAGDFTPLDQAIPELLIGPRLDRGTLSVEVEVEVEKDEEKLVGHLGFEPRANGLRIPDAGSPSSAIVENPQESTPGGAPSSAVGGAAGQSRANEPPADPVEQALADAIGKAAAAGQWSAVETLSRELTARREARANVVVLDAARRRGGRS
jgi:integrase